MLHGNRQAVNEATQWRRVEASWRSLPRNTLPLAFKHLREVLSSGEYERMVQEWQAGHREVRIENGFIVTCLTPT
jgi:hypothetical protein